MNIQTKLNWLAFIGLTFFMTSCEEVIEIDLNDASPALVIEGVMTDQEGQNEVRISQTVNFDEPNVFPAISDAIVVLSDDRGNEDTFEEVEPGVYKPTLILKGEPGTLYTLQVTIEGETYTASSQMPANVNLDSLTVQRISALTDDLIAVVPNYIDPIGVENYYQFVQFNNGEQTESIFVWDDQNNDGLNVSRPLLDPSLETEVGDVVTIEMRSIDRTTYRYFIALGGTVGGGGGNTSTPANPDNNWNGEILGYFSAHTTQQQTITIDE